MFLAYLTSYHITYLIVHNIFYIYKMYKPVSFNEEILGREDPMPLAIVWLHCDANYVHKKQ